MSSTASGASSVYVSSRSSSMGSLNLDDRFQVRRADAMKRALRGMEAELVDLVLEHACPSVWMDWLRLPLECATSAGSLASVKRLLAVGVDWKTGSHRRSRPGPLLHTAAASGNEGVVEELVKAGADVHAVDKMRSQRTALHLAASEGTESAARALISAGAAVDARDSRGWTPLHVASLCGHRGVVVFLLLKGADALNKTSLEGDTPLHLAASGGHEGVISDLLSFGNACVGCSNLKRETALHVAAKTGRVAACITLLRAGASSGRVSSQGVSPLDVAALNGHAGRLLDVLTAAESKADRRRRCSLALYYATKANKPDTIRYLVALGANVNHKRFGGGTCLHLSAARGHYLAAQALLQTGCDVDCRTDDSLTPLHEACMFSRSSMVELLLHWNADESATNSENRTPSDVLGVGDSDVDDDAVEISNVIRGLLVRAPADRVWRRRGWLVLCRARWLSRVTEARYPARVRGGMACEQELEQEEEIGKSKMTTRSAWKRDGWCSVRALDKGKGPSRKGKSSTVGKGKGRAKDGVASNSEGKEKTGHSVRRKVPRATLRLGRSSMLVDYVGGVDDAQSQAHGEGARFVGAVERLVLLREEGVFREILAFL